MGRKDECAVGEGKGLESKAGGQDKMENRKLRLKPINRQQLVMRPMDVDSWCRKIMRFGRFGNLWGDWI